MLFIQTIIGEDFAQIQLEFGHILGGFVLEIEIRQVVEESNGIATQQRQTRAGLVRRRACGDIELSAQHAAQLELHVVHA